MSGALVELTVEAGEWRRAVPDLRAVATDAVRLALDAAALPPAGYAISVLACDDARMRALNAAFRGKDRATNVLAWPAFDLAPARPGAAPSRPPGAAGGRRTLLGDVAIGLQTCRQEAKAAAIPLKNHVTHLILHGCLHLLGFDHATDADSDRMEGVERRALSAIGIPDPYK